jgi:hypothetical protein
VRLGRLPTLSHAVFASLKSCRSAHEFSSSIGTAPVRSTKRSSAPLRRERNRGGNGGSSSGNDRLQGRLDRVRLAGAGGFEPPHGGTKIRCLTAWLRPNLLGSPGLIYLAFLPGTSVALMGTTAEHSSVGPKLHPSSPPNKPGKFGCICTQQFLFRWALKRKTRATRHPHAGQFAVPTASYAPHWAPLTRPRKGIGPGNSVSN